MINAFVDVMIIELQLLAENGVSGPFEFIYFGGGTPSVLSDEQVARIIQVLLDTFGIKTGCEITFEMHPTHISQSRLASLYRIGVNRVSSGIQSLHETILTGIHATHNADASIRALESLACWEGKSAIDLLYRCPLQTIASWERDLRLIAERFQIPHLSCYSLYLENDSNQPNDKVDIEMAATALATCNELGYAHYASCASGGFDFAKPQHVSRYELEHWMAPQASYLGVGPGALGFVAETLTANRSKFSDYARTLHAKQLPLCSATKLAKTEAMHRYLVLGVKTIEVPLAPFLNRFGVELTDMFASQVAEIVAARLAIVDGKYFRLTDLGRLFVDQISMRFWSDLERDIIHPETNVLKTFERAFV